MMFQELYGVVLPVLLQLAGIVLAAIIGQAALKLKTRWGIDIEQAHQDSLHRALMSGIRAALMRGLTGTSATEVAIAYAQRSVPDAMKALNPAPDVLRSLAEAKLREAHPLLAVDPGADFHK